MPRRAWLLLAAVALPSTSLLAQEQPPPDVSTPPVSTPDPVVSEQPPVTQPPATQTTPPVAETTPPPEAEATPTPTTEAPAAPTQRTTARTTRTTPAGRTPIQRRTTAPVRQAAPAAAPAAAAAEPPAQTAAPAAPAPAPAAAPAPLPVPEEPVDSGPSILTWVIGAGLLLLLAFALFSMLRHRRRREADLDHEDVEHAEAPLRDEPPIYTEPAPVTAAPAVAAAAMVGADEPDYRREVMSSPIGDVVDPEEFAPSPADEAIAVAEEAVVARADAADAEALVAASAAPDGRPWLEFLMRPVRAGTSKDAAVVEFELTVGNTGDAPARDVRISTFMFAAGSAQESEMERMLIDPPANAEVTEVDIAAGDAKRVEAAMALPREALAGDAGVLPVVVADARYRLPDGSEGRTFAQFEVGLPSDSGGLDPFPTDRTSGLLEGVEARLHGEPERV